MKRTLLISSLLLCFASLQAQLKEDFTPNPTGWILSQGARFGEITANDLVITPGVGGNNPAAIGTPAVNKTSNTVEVCLAITAYSSSLNTKVAFPCNTYIDVLFVKSSVTSSGEAEDPANILARVDNHLLPANGGSTCFTFNFPPSVTDQAFKVFFSFHAACTQPGIKYVIDSVDISGVDEECATAGCLPTAIDDHFVRPNSGELAFNGVLYGSNINYPAPPGGYVCDATGTDNDQNDDYSHVKWSLNTPPSNGAVVINENGTFTITRNSLLVTQVTFTYKMSDDGADDNFATTGDNLSATATVTAQFSMGVTMPVSLINYFATRDGSTVTVRWTTTYESNNKGFELQRSVGSSDYATIASVGTKAKDGNSFVAINYEYRDNNATTQTSMYRLVQIDNDGARKIHAIKAVPGQSASNNLHVYPNPSLNGQVTVALSNTTEKNVTILNLQGKVIKVWNSYRQDNLVITNLESGMYVIQVVDNVSGERRSEKILVIK